MSAKSLLVVCCAMAVLAGPVPPEKEGDTKTPVELSQDPPKRVAQEEANKPAEESAQGKELATETSKKLSQDPTKGAAHDKAKEPAEKSAQGKEKAMETSKKLSQDPTKGAAHDKAKEPAGKSAEGKEKTIETPEKVSHDPTKRAAYDTAKESAGKSVQRKQEAMETQEKLSQGPKMRAVNVESKEPADKDGSPESAQGTARELQEEAQDKVAKEQAVDSRNKSVENPEISGPVNVKVKEQASQICTARKVIMEKYEDKKNAIDLPQLSGTYNVLIMFDEAFQSKKSENSRCISTTFTKKDEKINSKTTVYEKLKGGDSQNIGEIEEILTKNKNDVDLQISGKMTSVQPNIEYDGYLKFFHNKNGIIGYSSCTVNQNGDDGFSMIISKQENINGKEQMDAETKASYEEGLNKLKDIVNLLFPEDNEINKHEFETSDVCWSR